jgi:glycosyltransferase involved in cell wall biosynthesis
VNDVRWFASNSYTSLIVPELRRRGLSIALDGNEPARLAVAMSAAVAVQAWRYARARGCPVLLYIWDLHAEATRSGTADPVWWVAGRFLRLPRPVGGFPSRRGYFSRLRYMAARSVEVWVPSEMTRTTVLSRYGITARKVPYCYDSERFHPGTGARASPATLLTVSRLQPYKNQAATLRAAARLDGKVQARLIGQGESSRSLEKLAAKLGVRCHIDADATDAAVNAAYHAARVVICPSYFEGFGLTPVEAVASGTPVVASDIPPHREFVGGAARLFPLDNDEALVAAVTAALEDHPPDHLLVRDLTIPAAADRFAGYLAPLLGRF